MTPDHTLVESIDGESADGTAQRSDRASEMELGGQPSHGVAETSTDNGSLPLLFGFIGVILAIGFARSWWFPGILAGLLFMLFMHELGHFLTARASGMKVTEFFLGFGPKIWSFNRGETEYGVKAIPAGAYVRIMGMTNLDDVNPVEEHRTYRSQPYWQRMMTICAGSAMHFLMALIAIVVLFGSYGYQGFNGPPWVVGQVVQGSTASSLGIQVGDTIESVNDDSFANWDEFGELVSDLEEGPVEIVIRRDGREQALNGDLGVRPEDVLLDGFGLSLLEEVPALGAQAGFVWPQDPAEQFGIEVGDVILSAGGVELPDDVALSSVLRQRDGDDVSIRVLRGGEIISLLGTAQATDDLAEVLELFGAEAGDRLLRLGGIDLVSDGVLRQALSDQAGDVVRIQVLRGGETLTLDGPVSLNRSTPFRGFFGVGPSFVPEPDRSIGDSAGSAFGDFGTIAKTNIVGLIDLANPMSWGGGDDDQIARRAAEINSTPRTDVAPSQCGGPDTNRPLSVVGIGRLISCSESADQVLFLFAVVNIFIGIFNLVPLLPLDGGHAAIATYERTRGLITRKPHRVDAAKLVPVTWVVILLLVGLGLWTTTLDIFSW
ncbi:MAG: site-2 protease family protein [Acidimicrobiales bacterium]|jgi:membrane-associated protease RseP (regulator of RpoE activity)